MIYLDSSVALAYLLAEDRYPTNALWDQPIVSSRLLECEVWNCINTRRLADSHGDLVRSLIGRIGGGAGVRLNKPGRTRPSAASR